MKKKFLSIICIVLMLIFCVTSFTCFAAETDTTVTEGVVNEGETNAITNTGLTDEDEKEHTFLSRLWEYIVTNKTELVGLFGDGVILALAFFVKFGADKKNKKIAEAVAEVQKTTGLNLSNQDSIVRVVNDMIESYNSLEAEYKAFKEAYEKYGKTELDRNKIVGALTTEVSTVLEILSTVYSNNKNLPQGVKDIISIKYSNCLKALENDEKLASVVEVLHNVSGDSEKNVLEAAVENTEA